jgi:tRNA (guanine10-N2)-dimethyltransferase
VPRFFFLLSGEHKTLPFEELKAILHAEDIAYRELQALPQVLRLHTTADAVAAIQKRAALTRVCCRELLHCAASFQEIVETAQSGSLQSLLQPGESFAVRIRRVGDAAPTLTSMVLERKLGELILNKAGTAHVNLSHPHKTFFGTITNDNFVLGIKLAEIVPAPFMQRRPGKRPFFHPSAMVPKLARCMVNLARPRPGDLVLDPFCGTGSFLIEAGLLGYRAVGFDAKRHMVEGSRRNLTFFNIKYEGLGVADARHLPLAAVDCIVTDPPYGRSASTLGYTTREIVHGFLAVAVDRIGKGQRICMAAPKTIGIGEMAETQGFTHVQSHLVYVHRSLTREICVLEKK